MRVQLIKRPFAWPLLTVMLLAGFSCSTEQPSTSGAATPTEAYKQLFAAVKAKDIEAIKRNFSKKTNEFALMAAERQNSPVEKVYANGFTATTFAESLPEVRDERIAGDMGAVEVWNSKESRWEDLPFVKEDGMWKLAVGDMFAGTYQSPGRGRDSLEKEAANAMSNTSVPTVSSNNANIPVVRNANKAAK
ncbi:MAG TPA: hypothetical protein VNA17_04495 [Pyrinomonadaceae bacterium]|nr:hypothetical protein [Pyrinomonadaceae bacterium]